MMSTSLFQVVEPLLDPLGRRLNLYHEFPHAAKEPQQFYLI
jgi:hypothetical protein